MPEENPGPPPSPIGGAGQMQAQDREVASTQTTRVASEMPPVGRQVFRGLSRELNDADLANPGVQKMLLAELERMDNECASLRGYIERFYEADKDRGILKERLKTVTSIEVIFGTGMVIGGAILSISFSFPEAMKPYTTISFILGGLIVVVVTVARLIKR